MGNSKKVKLDNITQKSRSDDSTISIQTKQKKKKGKKRKLNETVRVN